MYEAEGISVDKNLKLFCVTKSDTGIVVKGGEKFSNKMEAKTFRDGLCIELLGKEEFKKFLDEEKKLPYSVSKGVDHRLYVE